MSYQPKTGAPCACRPGVQRDNCPACEGTGWRIDFAAIRRQVAAPRDEAIAQLRRLCPPGSTVLTIGRHVSRSGKSRSISAAAWTATGPAELDGYLHAAGIACRDRKHGGVRVRWGALDGRELVDRLAAVLGVTLQHRRM